MREEGAIPIPLRAAKLAVEAGADNITAHLREDRRHITDEDIARLTAAKLAPLNLEMAVTEEMLAIALKVKPHASCLVPERRQEITTEGGLDVAGQLDTLTPFVAKLRRAGIQVALFIDPEPEQIEASRKVRHRRDRVPYRHLLPGGDRGRHGGGASASSSASSTARARPPSLGLEVHAGHGLDYDNVGPVASIPEIVELNIGHYLVGEAVFRRSRRERRAHARA